MTLVLLFILLGCLMGSFFGVLIDRFGTDRSWWHGRSRCESCQLTLGIMDLIPIGSYILLGGRCRSCKARIPARHVAIEIITAILFGLVAATYMFAPLGSTFDHFVLFMLRDLFFVSLLEILFFIDARHGVLPDTFTVPGIVLIFALNIFFGYAWASLVFGGLLLGGFFAAQYFLSRGTWVGSGDIRFGVLLGVMFGPRFGILALAIAYIIGALWALYLLAQKKATRESAIPFGPFLSIAGILVLFFGSWILEQL